MAIIDEKNYTITDKERDDRRVARLHNRPNNNGSYGQAGLGPEDVKKAFDQAVDLVVERHNAFVKDVCEQVNEHSELIGDPDDTEVGDENVYQVLRYARMAVEQVSETLGEESDESGADTVYGQAKRAEDAADGVEENRKAAEAAADKAEGVLGTESDESGVDTVYGQKAALISEATRLREETVTEANAILGDEDDGFSDNTMRGLYNSALELAGGGDAGRLGEALERIKAIQESHINGRLPVDRTFPVGAIYLSVNSTSPASLFGGEWERLKDRFLLGAGDTYAAGNTGGSADAVIAEHDHFIFGRDAGATTTDYVSGRCYVTTYVSTGDRPYTLKQSANQTDQPINGVTSKTGVSGVGKNMPPYLTVYMWKRTA